MSWRSEIEDRFEHNDLARVKVTVHADGVDDDGMADLEHELDMLFADELSFESVVLTPDIDRRQIVVDVELFVPKTDVQNVSPDAAHDVAFGPTEQVTSQIAGLLDTNAKVVAVTGRPA